MTEDKPDKAKKEKDKETATSSDAYKKLQLECNKVELWNGWRAMSGLSTHRSVSLCGCSVGLVVG